MQLESPCTAATEPNCSRAHELQLEKLSATNSLCVAMKTQCWPKNHHHDHKKTPKPKQIKITNHRPPPPAKKKKKQKKKTPKNHPTQHRSGIKQLYDLGVLSALSESQRVLIYKKTTKISSLLDTWRTAGELNEVILIKCLGSYMINSKLSASVRCRWW